MKQTGSIQTLKWIRQVCGPGSGWTLVRALVRIGQGSIALLYAHALGAVVDAAASGDRAVFAREFILFALYTVTSILLLLLNRYLQERGKNALDKAFRLRTFSQLLRRDYGRISKAHNGEWMTRITSDVDVITTAISQIIPEISNILIRVVGALIALYRIVPLLIYVLIPGGLIMVGASLVLQKRLKGYHKTVQKADGAVRSFIQERLYSLLVIHAFTQENASETVAAQAQDQLNAARMRRLRFVLVCNGAIGGAMITAQLVGIGMCCQGILKGTITYGMVSTVLYLINMLEAPLSSASSYVSQYYGMLASAERIMEIEAYPPDITSEPVCAEEVHRYYTRQLEYLGLEQAVFSYDEGEENAVLQNFDLKIRKGSCVAFVGASGCGKSTTLKVLMGLCPLQGGNAYLQDEDGTRQPLNAAWRGLFAYVPQGNQLISGSLRETLTFGDPEQMKKEEKLREALQIACADSFVDELPNGLDTLLGERGVGLSEGQVQRLSLARAVLSDRPILLLDEATSALDAATEEQVLKNLQAMKNRTVLIVTHRPAALAICDDIVRFE